MGDAIVTQMEDTEEDARVEQMEDSASIERIMPPIRFRGLRAGGFED